MTVFQKQSLTFEHKNQVEPLPLQGIICLFHPTEKLFLDKSSNNPLMTHAFGTNHPQPDEKIGRIVQSDNLTRYIFKETRRLVPVEKTLARELAVVLNLSESAVYKKLKGGNQLSLEEAALLAQHFHISLDNFLLPKAAVVPMAFYPLAGQVADPIDFLRGLLAQVEQATRLTGARLYYATTEIPDPS